MKREGDDDDDESHAICNMIIEGKIAQTIQIIAKESVNDC